MRGVRRFAEADIPQVAALHHRVFQIKSPLSPDLLQQAYQNYFRNVFWDYPGKCDQVSPLVYEVDGKIVGFLGAVARRFQYRGQPLVAAVFTQFVVDEAHRGLPGLLLVKTLMNGGQDLSFADDCTDSSRALWEQLGATPSYCQSAHWYLPIRPVSFIAQRIGFLRPVAKLGDWAASAIPGSPLLKRPKVLKERPVTAADLAGFHRASRAKITPDYAPEQLKWLLTRAGQLEELHGGVEGAVLENDRGEPVGCFLYHWADHKPNISTLSEVIHFAACPEHSLTVLQHLFEHARERGVAALAGRVPPDHLTTFSKAQCILHPYTKWFLVHSRNPEIQAAVSRGDCFLTPLDGEWCCHFNYRSVNG